MSEYILRSDDPQAPRDRVVVSVDDLLGGLIDVTSETATSETATSGSAQAQTAEVHDRLVLTPDQAAWLRDVLIAMQIDTNSSDFEVAVAKRRLAGNPLAVER